LIDCGGGWSGPHSSGILSRVLSRAGSRWRRRRPPGDVAWVGLEQAEGLPLEELDVLEELNVTAGEPGFPSSDQGPSDAGVVVPRQHAHDDDLGRVRTAEPSV
jgi:hypothetical protein